jgi:hypothetical protein
VLTAGVVVQLADGQVFHRTAIDERKAKHAFGEQGAALHAVAEQLCASLCAHWLAGDRSDWQPPFEGAQLAQVEDFTARDAEAGMDFALSTQSSLYGLLAQYDIASQTRTRGITSQVQRIVVKQHAQRHLDKCFGRELKMGADAGKLKVDFLGQNFACYMHALTESDLGVENNTVRALAKMVELQAVRRFVQGRPKSFGLLEEERPRFFELVAVGKPQQGPQRHAMARITMLADKREVRVRSLPDAAAAAEHLVQMERKAA